MFVITRQWFSPLSYFTESTVCIGPGAVLLGKGLDSFPFQGLRYCQNISLDPLAPLGFKFYPELGVFPSEILDFHHRVVWFLYNPGSKALDLRLKQSSRWIWLQMLGKQGSCSPEAPLPAVSPCFSTVGS